MNDLYLTSTSNDVNWTSSHEQETSQTDFIIMITHSIIASVGIVANLTVVVVFLQHRKFRKKIPNIFIIHQVSGRGPC